MAHDNDENPPVSPYPNPLDQNPAPAPLYREPNIRSGSTAPQHGTDFDEAFRSLVDRIMATFLSVLPDNYVSQVNGPFYTLQFQALAEALARIQLTAQQIALDSDYDFTRSEFLWEIVGSLVFPGASAAEGAPAIDGDVSYREFLHRMVLLLLKGATKEAMEEGVALLLDENADVTIIEKYLGARDPASAWGLDEQFEFEVNIDNNNEFPENPFLTQENIILILEALKPAHTLYEFRFLFKDAFGQVFDDTDGLTWEMESYYYDDFRKFCLGAKEITGTGDTLSDRFLFSDPDLSFESVEAGATLEITSGVNEGRYRVRNVLTFPMGDDATARAYTTSPTGLSGTATVSGDVITDSSQDWAAVEEGEILTFTEGPNAGSYRLQDLLGPDGGPIGSELAVGPATEVRVSPSLLRVTTRMPSASVTGQSYTVVVDRLGVRTPKERTAEDASAQFYL